MTEDVRKFFQRVQLKPNVVSGHVSSVTINSRTGAQEYATVTVGGNNLRIKLDAAAPMLANGDAIRLEQHGYAASAEYRLAGVEAGGRPTSGSYQILNDGTALGGMVYAGGDFVTGKLDGGNVFSEYATGRLYHRVGKDVYGIEYPDGKQLFGRAVLDGGEWVPAGANVWITPTDIHLRNGTTDAIRFSTDGTAYLQHALRVGGSNGRLIVGEIGDIINGVASKSGHFGLRAYNIDGLPCIALVTGSPDDPDSPLFKLGAEGDAERLIYQHGSIDLTCGITAKRGVVGGMILRNDMLESVNGRIKLISESSGNYTEGLVLMGDVPATVGAIRWVDPAQPSWNVGIEYTGLEGATWTKYSHVSTPEGDAGTTCHKWVSGGWGSYNRTLVFDSNGDLTGARHVEANLISAHKLYYTDSDPLAFEPQGLVMRGLRWSVLVPPHAVPTVTNEGSVAAITNYAGFSEGVFARLLLTNSPDIPIPLNVRPPVGPPDAGVYLLGLKLLWKKTTGGASSAYLSEVKLVKQDFDAGTKEALTTLTNVQYQQAAGVYTTVVQAEASAPLLMETTFDKQYFLTVKGVQASAGELRIMGVELILCDATYKEINWG